MKKVLLFLFVGFALTTFVGCDNKEKYNISNEFEIVDKVNSASANLFILIEPTEDNSELKVLFENKLCSKGIVGENNVSYPLKVDKGFYDIKVIIKNKIHSTLRFEVTNEKQWIDISYLNSQVAFNIRKTPKLFD